MPKTWGHLQKLDIKSFFEVESNPFSAWLAQEEILGLLGTAIGTPLIPMNDPTPTGIGEDRLLAKQVDQETLVMIQGQLEETTHKDLGQLVTFAAGFAVTRIVWVGARISDAHRHALDWLNNVTAGSVFFYGVELELWQIDDSAPAPKFNLVCRPNAWARNLKVGKDIQRSRVTLDEGPPATTERIENKAELPEPKEQASSDHAPPKSTPKEGVAVRQNFVYTKTYT